MVTDEDALMDRLQAEMGSLRWALAKRHDGTSIGPRDLAGLHDEPAFERLASRCLARQAHGGRLVAIVLLRLDVDVGASADAPAAAVDDALRRIGALRLRHATRADDVLGRNGSSGLAWLLPGLRGEQEARSACLRLISKVSGGWRIHEGDVRLRVTIGSALFPAGGRTFGGLRTAAERALGRAQREDAGVICADGLRREES